MLKQFLLAIFWTYARLSRDEYQNEEKKLILYIEVFLASYDAV